MALKHQEPEVEELVDLTAKHRGIYMRIIDIIRKNGTPVVPMHCGCEGFDHPNLTCAGGAR